MSILIVDDDEEYLEYMWKVVSRSGYNPLLASSGAAARQALERQSFSLFITDLRIPDSSGEELMEVARKINPLTVCIAMTAFGSVDSALGAMRLGAFDYLLKPSDAEVIKIAVQRGLEHHRLRKTLIEHTSQMEKFKRESLDAVGLITEVSHELRNILGVVYGWSSYLLQSDAKELAPEDLSKGIHSIQKNVETMRAVLEKLIPPQSAASQDGLGK